MPGVARACLLEDHPSDPTAASQQNLDQGVPPASAVVTLMATMVAEGPLLSSHALPTGAVSAPALTAAAGSPQLLLQRNNQQ